MTKVFQHVKAPNDTNGNPRRCFVIYDLDSGRGITEVIDEGYSGRPIRLRDMYELANVNVSAREYRSFIAIGKSNV